MLGTHLGLDEDQLEEVKKSPHPTASVLMAAKGKDINIQWMHIVEAPFLDSDGFFGREFFTETL